MSGTDPWDSEVNKTKLGSHGTACKWSAKHTKRCWVELRYYEEKQNRVMGEGKKECQFLVFVILKTFIFFLAAQHTLHDLSSLTMD